MVCRNKPLLAKILRRICETLNKQQCRTSQGTSLETGEGRRITSDAVARRSATRPQVSKTTRLCYEVAWTKIVERRAPRSEQKHDPRMATSDSSRVSSQRAPNAMGFGANHGVRCTRICHPWPQAGAGVPRQTGGEGIALRGGQLWLAQLAEVGPSVTDISQMLATNIDPMHSARDWPKSVNFEQIRPMRPMLAEVGKM